MSAAGATAAALFGSAAAALFAGSLQANYTTLFPDNLRKTFKSPSTLLLATEEASNSSIAALPQIAYGCFAYSNGQEFAAANRNNAVPLVLQPILVSGPSEQDTMCFRSDGLLAAEVEATFPRSAFQALHLNALSVEDTIEQLVDYPNDMDRFPAFDYFTLFYSPSYFAGNADPSNAIRENFQRRMLTLEGYRTAAAFDAFFWTAPATISYFRFHSDNDDFDFLQDKRRHEQWLRMREELEEYIVMERDLGRDTNVCTLQHISESIHFTWLEDAGKINIPLADQPQYPPDMYAMCLAFVTATFAADPSVYFATLTHNPLSTNFRARSIMESLSIGSDEAASPYTAAGLRGDDQVASCADTGVDLSSCYFLDTSGNVPFSSCFNAVYDSTKRKVIEYTYLDGYSDTIDEVGGHGTHVAGTIVGNIQGADISTTGTYDGVAPNAKLAFFDMGKDGILYYPGVPTTYNPGYKAGARVQSNSWGSMYSGSQYYYGADIDEYLFLKTDHLIIFSAGNDGSNGAQTITMDASSKNVIALGSSESSGGNMSYIAWYSSQGPAYDGRIKPEIVAPGDSLMSALSNGENGASCGTEYKTGTSMAAPAAAGAALLVRQYFADASFWKSMCNTAYSSCTRFTPSGVLVKAVLLHSGEPMVLFDGSQGGGKDASLGAPPDSTQGFGRVALPNVLPLAGVYTDFDLFVDDLVKLSEDDSQQYLVSIPTSSSSDSSGSSSGRSSVDAEEAADDDGVARRPSKRRTRRPINKPTTHPLSKPVAQPTYKPSAKPTCKPTTKPVLPPAVTPTFKPSRKPSAKPVTTPVAYKPSAKPVATPTKAPTSGPATNILKITISWYDAPNVQGSTTDALVQNLDLSVTSPSGVKYYGNGGNSADTINNNEQIYIADPEAGDWRVSVTSRALPYAGYQKYSLVITSAGSVAYA